jgi:hypothetical protein
MLVATFFVTLECLGLLFNFFFFAFFFSNFLPFSRHLFLSFSVPHILCSTLEQEVF